MIQTAKLRFVERDSYSRNGEVFTNPHKETILQCQTRISNGLQDQTFRQFGESLDGLRLQRKCCHHHPRNIKNL